MCDFIARTNWSNIKSNYFVNSMITFDLSYYPNITITVTFVNHPTLCRAFFFFPPKYYPHKSHIIFHINLYVFNIHTEVPNGTNKLNHVKRSAVFQNKPFGITYGRMNHLCRAWNKRIITIVQNTFCTHRAQWLSLVDERFVIDKLAAVSIYFGLGVTNNAAKPDCTLPTGDNGSLYEGPSSSKLIVIKNNETLHSRKQQSCQKCKHRQSHFDFLNTDSKKISTWVSLLKRNVLLPKLCFS
jgi:hypothetical protein